jgi:hypothetical protein
MRIEFIAAPGIAKFWGNNFADKSRFRFSMAGGIGLNILLNEHSSFNPKIIVSRKGQLYKSTIDLRDEQNEFAGTVKYKNVSSFDYLCFPLMYGRTLGMKKLKFKLEMGPYISFLLQSKSKSFQDGELVQNIKDTNLYQKMDLGISTGISAYFFLNESLNIRLGLMSNVGVMNASLGPVYNNGALRMLSLNFITGVVCRLH